MSVYNDLENVHKIIGVCPQFDLLWPQLTAYEHLELFSGIRDIPKDKMEEEIRTRLEEVSLWDVKDNPSSSFSGGMKRRLSVAICASPVSPLSVELLLVLGFQFFQSQFL